MPRAARAPSPAAAPLDAKRLVASVSPPAPTTAAPASTSPAASSGTGAPQRGRRGARRRDHPPVMIIGAEASQRFACFGSSCAAYVSGGAAPQEAVTMIRTRLLAWHRRFTRFSDDSELSLLNQDPRDTVPASVVMRHFVRAALAAARQTDGLVDASLLQQVQAAGYHHDLGTPLPLSVALALAPSARPAGGRSPSPWERVSVDDGRGTVTRPPGVRFDSGGLAKGLFADLLAGELGERDSFAIDCGGDLRLGGSGVTRAVEVASPFDQSVLHTFALSAGGVATSGIGRRSWLDDDGLPAHHVLDPRTGRPAYTGIVQATAVAPTALQAEIRAKAALLSGPARAPRWLRDGGALVLNDGRCQVFAAGSHLAAGADAA